MPRFVPRQRKHRVLERERNQASNYAIAPDSNPLEVLPAEQKQREAKKQALRDELRAQRPIMSAKKKKRLEKYIDTKLRKEESLDLIKKLAASKVDTSLFHTSKQIGVTRESRRQTLSRALRERNAGINVAENEDILLVERRHQDALLPASDRNVSSHDASHKVSSRDASHDVFSHDASFNDDESSNPTVSSDRKVATEVENDESIRSQTREYQDNNKTLYGKTKLSNSDVTQIPVAESTFYTNDTDLERIIKQSYVDDITPSSDENTTNDDEDPEDTAKRPCINDETISDQKSAHVHTRIELPTKRPRTDNDIRSEGKRQKVQDTCSESSWHGFDSEADQTFPSNLKGTRDTNSESESDSDSISNSSSNLDSDSDLDANSNDVTSDQSDTSSSSNSEQRAQLAARKGRASAFKAWAEKQRNEALGYEPVPAIPSLQTDLKALNFEPRPADDDPLPPELQITKSDRTAFAVHVDRSPDVLAARLKLPVVAEEQKIMEAIHNNPVVVIWGATGSGKTTQIPQFLFEAGYGSPNSPHPGMIGVTQPRRVAAVSMAKRVGDEMGPDLSQRVSYKIRFEGNVHKSTAIKFMTDGILLREASEDISLRNYSAIIIDEAHERSKDTDILIGMMSRIVKLRQELHREDPTVSPLKLIIMSATLRISDFTGNARLFRQPPPLVQAEGRQHPVTIHWARHTRHDYLEEAYRKVCKGHKTLPEGGMLVFLTGQNEITTLMHRLRQTFSSDRGPFKAPPVLMTADDGPLEAEDVELGGLTQSGSISDSDSDSNADSEIEFTGLDGDTFGGENSNMPMHVLPLYSLLPTKEQLRVFEPAPDGCRLVVLATNVAETSITIPGISYVFDCGRSKDRHHDADTGVQSFDIGWISKASANQRAGRAGRTGPGHCYRLYSSAVYERDLPEHAEPEILRTPVEGVVLQLCGLNVPNILEKFPFPTPPDPHRLIKAQRLLTYLGALSTSGQELTPLGRQMSGLPIFPRFAKILLSGHRFECLAYTIALVSALSVSDIFIAENQLDLSSELPTDRIFTNAERLAEDARESRRKAYNRAQAHFSRLSRDSDGLKLIPAVLEHGASGDQDAFCDDHFLRSKALREAQLLQGQLARLLGSGVAQAGNVSCVQGSFSEPTVKQVRYLKQTLAAGFIDQVAIRADAAPTSPASTDPGPKPTRAINVPYLPLFFSHASRADDAAVYIHPSSVLARSPVASLPTYIVYSRLQRPASSAGARAGRVRMHPLTPVSGAQLYALAKGTPLIEMGKPIREVALDDVSPAAGVGGDVGPQVRRREVWRVPTLRGSKAGQGWPLPAQRVVQRKTPGGAWADE
ncbi:MAG: hypothetical protein M1825_004546 [Sarcosagium campestre]|nr:MAG: hypothetical protein M1825_004546 [Sarcosagium campestre]